MLITLKFSHYVLVSHWVIEFCLQDGTPQPFRYNVANRRMTTAFEPKALPADSDLMALRATVFGAKMIHDGGLGSLPHSDMAKTLWEATQSNLLVDSSNDVSLFSHLIFESCDEFFFWGEVGAHHDSHYKAQVLAHLQRIPECQVGSTYQVSVLCSLFLSLAWKKGQDSIMKHQIIFNWFWSWAGTFDFNQKPFPDVHPLSPDCLTRVLQNARNFL